MISREKEASVSLRLLEHIKNNEASTSAKFIKEVSRKYVVTDRNPNKSTIAQDEIPIISYLIESLVFNHVLLMSSVI